jgi:DNA primase
MLALFEEKEINLRILTLPEGIDPCDFIATHGSDPFRALLATAVDPLEHKFKAVTNGLDTLTDTHRASQAAEQLLATLAQIRPQSSGASSQTLLREEQMLSRIAREFHLKEELLRERLITLRRKKNQRGSRLVGGNTQTSDNVEQGSAVTPVPRPAELPASDRLLLELILAHSSYFVRIRTTIDPSRIETTVAKRIYNVWVNLSRNDEEPEAPRLVAAFDDPGMKSFLVGIDSELSNKPVMEPEQMLQEVLGAYERQADAIDRRAALVAARKNSTTDAEQLLAQFCKDSTPKHRLDYERRKK